MMLRTLSFVVALAMSSAVAAQTRPFATLAARDAFQLTCAPFSPSSPPNTVLRVAGGTVHGRLMFSVGDPLIVNAGLGDGLRPGQRYYARRVVQERFAYTTAKAASPISIHTAGWVEIAQVSDHSAVARVAEACDGIVEGDYLEPFVTPAVPKADPEPGGPDFKDPARIVLGDERRQMGAAGSLMVIDRGSDADIYSGLLVTIYRETLSGEGPIETVGSGMVLTVRPETALIRITASRDAVYVGDLVAFHRLK
jgi:hypothetical protein